MSAVRELIRVAAALASISAMMAFTALAENPPAAGSEHLFPKSFTPGDLTAGHGGALPPGANPHENANPHDGGSFSAGDRGNATWTVPSGWSELPPTSMRLGNFLYTDPNGQKVEITVTSLPGPAGGVPANFAMWRSQLGLPKVDDQEIMKESKTLKVAGTDAPSIDVVSADNLVDGKSKGRIVGVVLPRESTTWFFKMKGEESAVQNAREGFLSLLGSFKFEDSSKG